MPLSNRVILARQRKAGSEEFIVIDLEKIFSSEYFGQAKKNCFCGIFF